MTRICSLISFAFLFNSSFAQIGINTEVAHPLSIVEIHSDSGRGLLVPVITDFDSINFGIDDSADGMLVYDKRGHIFKHYHAGSKTWVPLSPWANDENEPGTMMYKGTVDELKYLYADTISAEILGYYSSQNGDVAADSIHAQSVTYNRDLRAEDVIVGHLIIESSGAVGASETFYPNYYTNSLILPDDISMSGVTDVVITKDLNIGNLGVPNGYYTKMFAKYINGMENRTADFFPKYSILLFEIGEYQGWIRCDGTDGTPDLSAYEPNATYGYYMRNSDNIVEPLD